MSLERIIYIIWKIIVIPKRSPWIYVYGKNDKLYQTRFKVKRINVLEGKESTCIYKYDETEIRPMPNTNPMARDDPFLSKYLLE